MNDDKGSLEGREGAWKLMSGFSKCFFFWTFNEDNVKRDHDQVYIYIYIYI
jgi:hypothetical protein